MPTTTPPAPVNPIKKSSATARRALTLGCIAVILAFATACFTALIWQEFSNIKNRATTQSAQITTTLERIKTKNENLQQQLSTTQSDLRQLSEKTSQVSTQRAISKAAYLAHLANLHLTVGYDATAALQLLDAANQALRSTSSTTAFNLKHALLQDIAALKAAPKVDVTNLVLRLDQLSQTVQNLPGISARTAPVQTPAMPLTAPSDKTLSWYKKMTNSLSGLKELVVIRHIKKPVMPLLSPEQLTFLRENVQLKIAQAEWAVLQQKPMLYKISLNLAHDWLKNYYRDQTAAANILENLQKLSAINIKPSLPNISKTLNAFSQKMGGTSSDAPTEPKKPVTTNPDREAQ
jgi:uroporphyrin-III C-methyltransferase